MMILSGTKTLTASLAAAPATTQPTFVVAYAEVNATQVTEDTNEVTATGTTPVTVLSFPAAGFRRVIKSLFVTNLDTVPTTVTVFINGFPAGKATIGSGLSVDLASSTAIPVSQGQVATGTLMGNNSGVSNLPFALSATASLTLLGIPGLQTSGITGNLTLSKTGTTARTQTARDASGNLCLDSVNNGFTVSQSIDRGTGALPAPINSAAQCVTLANVDVMPSNIESFGYGTTGINLRGRGIGGTRAAPTATQDAQVFVNLVGTGYDGVSAHGDSAYVRIQADGLWSASNRGGLLTFFVTPNGGTIPAECMRLQNGCQTLGGIAAVAGNGLIQTASGTTKANGWALSTDLFFFRLSSGFATLQTSGVAPTDRHGLSLARGGYSAPGAHLSDADGDKLVIYNGDNQHSVIGQGNTSNFWFKSTNGTTGGSFEWYTGTAGATLRLTLNATGLVGTGAVLSSSSTAGVGYSTGAGGTVTQITSRTTGVTLNKITGAITLVSAAGSVAWQSFTVTNSAVAATDTIICNQVSGTDLNMIHVTAIAAGSFRISFATTAGVTVEQPVFRFTVIKSVSA
jgi:hypothetical protein